MTIFVNTCLVRKLELTSINTYLRHIRGALNTAYEWHPEAFRRRPRVKLIKTEKKLPRILTKKEIDKILIKAVETDPDMAPIIRFAIWTGCRRAEIIGLQWQKINLEAGQCIVLGKGNKERPVPLLAGAVESLGNPADIGLVFRRFHKDTVSKRFQSIAQAAGVQGVKFHSLRHSAATYMIESGMHPKAVQTILGHVDFRTTELYINLHNEFLKTEMQKFKI